MNLLGSTLFQNYALSYPLTPLGGVFIAIVGVFVCGGAKWPRARDALTAAGFLMGVLGIFLAPNFISHAVAQPTRIQVASIAIAIVVEIIAFAVFMRRARRSGPGAVVTASIMIVSGHFLLMTPAFGPLIAMLAVFGLLNAFVGLWRPSLPLGRLWLIDGLLKIGLGIAMICTAPALQ